MKSSPAWPKTSALLANRVGSSHYTKRKQASSTSHERSAATNKTYKLGASKNAKGHSLITLGTSGSGSDGLDDTRESAQKRLEIIALERKGLERSDSGSILKEGKQKKTGDERTSDNSSAQEEQPGGTWCRWPESHSYSVHTIHFQAFVEAA